ncbi:MAG: hypothetical protein SO014_03590 [Candidatus Limivicinus sp.]|nr:hypothetical protein [Clostridiales bacterium]MDY3859709.1 hypothetical protein [Candidatus Limivicinus sp.]
MKDKFKNRTAALERFKYPILILIAGVLLMLLPGPGEGKSTELSGDELVAHILSSSDGVGEAKVLISDSGVVVVCTGADDASVRLDIIRAVGSYTGFGADKITILKMADGA